MQDQDPTRWQWLSDEVLANHEPNQQNSQNQSPQSFTELWRWINDDDIRLTSTERGLRALLLIPLIFGGIVLLLILNYLVVNIFW